LKLDDHVQERIVAAIADGNYAETACRAGGISDSTFYRWLERGESDESGPYADFADAVRAAEAAAEIDALEAVKAARYSDWKSAMTFLERRFPSRWGRQSSGERESRQAPAREHDLSALTPDELETLGKLIGRISSAE
jgi:transposase-like protein